MSKSASPSAARSITPAVLRILIILNWVSGAAILVLLLLGPINRRWIMSSMDLTPSPEADHLVLGLRAIAVVGLFAIPVYYFILTRMLAIVDTVRAGDPFVAVNASRLQSIAWAQLALVFLGFFVDVVSKAVSIESHPLKFDTSFSVEGALAVLVTFVLARVFAEGTRMRDDLEGTV